ncbi:hypothetical protein LguiA_022466 [Lonicera macranthoides]
MEEKSHFVLVHGCCHGAWCWYKVATILSSDGHRVTAVDLGASGINPKQLDDIPTISGYLQPLMELMAALPPDEKVVLVGHSMGGIVISAAMEKFPDKVAVGIYVTAFMPDPEFNILDFNQKYFSDFNSCMDSKVAFDLGGNNPATSILFGPNRVTLITLGCSQPNEGPDSITFYGISYSVESNRVYKPATRLRRTDITIATLDQDIEIKNTSSDTATATTTTTAAATTHQVMDIDYE